jgi:hypothetical protein
MCQTYNVTATIRRKRENQGKAVKEGISRNTEEHSETKHDSIAS